jgi:ubiquinone biosynthesis protein
VTIVESTLGRPLAEAFASFDPMPIGRASVAVVHRAVLPGGRVVAVKVLRPRVESAIAVDLRVMQPLFRFLAGRVGIAAAGQMVRLLDGFSEQVAEELDLQAGARHGHFRRPAARPDLRHIVVPGPPAVVARADDGLPRRRPPSTTSSACGARRPTAGLEEMVRAGLRCARDGVFHGDVRQNMLFFPRRPGRRRRLGIVGRLDPRAHFLLRQTIAAARGRGGVGGRRAQ